MLLECLKSKGEVNEDRIRIHRTMMCMITLCFLLLLDKKIVRRKPKGLFLMNGK